MALRSFDKQAKYELHNYWDDGCTIECRYFKTKKEAIAFAENNGYVNYRVTKVW